MRVFLDANILFSAANPKWHTSKLVQWLIKNASCVTSNYATEEARRNLKTSFPEHVAGLETLLGKIEMQDAGIFEIGDGIELSEKDRPILAAAMASGSTHLLTGDKKDFKELLGKTIWNVRVVTQKMLAEELEKRGMI